MNCPYCGAACASGAGHSMHIAACAYAPGMRERMAQLAEDPTDSGAAVVLRVYKALAKAHGLPGHAVLVAQFGSYAAAMRWAGLRCARTRGGQPGNRNKLHDAADVPIVRAADVFAQEAEERRRAALEPWYLNACYSRPLPDGRRAWLIR